eukprot:364965-Chlamydomonas_euryale.AAC.4
MAARTVCHLHVATPAGSFAAGCLSPRRRSAPSRGQDRASPPGVPWRHPARACGPPCAACANPVRRPGFFGGTAHGPPVRASRLSRRVAPDAVHRGGDLRGCSRRCSRPGGRGAFTRGTRYASSCGSRVGRRALACLMALPRRSGWLYAALCQRANQNPHTALEQPGLAGSHLATWQPTSAGDAAGRVALREWVPRRAAVVPASSAAPRSSAMQQGTHAT